MDKKQIVSIIVPVYNVEMYLEECVDSLRKQTYENLEIVLVDDGSPDKSGEMCDDFVKRDSRVKVIHKQNEGLNFARKTGFENSTGEFIIFVDSDDFLAINAIEIMMGAVTRENLDLVIGGYKRFADGENIALGKAREVESIIVRKEESIDRLLLGGGPSNILMMTAWGKIFSRSIIESIDWDASNYRANEDEFMALQYYSKVEKSALLPTELYMYRNNPKSITKSAYRNSFKGKELNKFDTIEALHREAINRLGDKYQEDILAQYVYHFTITLGECLIDDSYMGNASASIEKYLLPKKNLFTDGVLTKVDPMTRTQLQGILDNGITGYFKNKISLMEKNEFERRGYIDHLESRLIEENNKHRDEAESLRGEIDYLKSPLGSAKTFLRAVYRKIKKSIGQ